MIELKNVSFGYNKTNIIKKMSFSVKQGEIFGFLGPSGAGKTTLQKILTGILTQYEGSVKIDGEECKNHSKDFYERIGVDFEFSTLYEKLSAKENLLSFQSLYKNTSVNIDQLLENVDLQTEADKKVSAYSKGMKARLNFIKALLHDPDILFLDEPTSGLDPTNSKVMKKMILAEKAKGKTIILTTHNMQDATELCDRVAFIVGGEIYALNSPDNLIMSRGANKIVYRYYDESSYECHGECLLEEVGSDAILADCIKQNQLISIHSCEPTLNDIFIDITGRTLK